MQIHLNTYGTYLHVKDAMFELRVPGPEGSQTHHLAAKRVTSIVFSIAGAMSTDALRLALKHNVDVMVAESDGFPLGRFQGARPGSTTRIRKNQLAASISEAGLTFTGRWLQAKLAGQAAHLHKLRKHRKNHQSLLDDKRTAILRLAESITAVCAGAGTVDAVADTLRGLEGTAGRLYFQALSQILPAKHQFAGRSFRPAADPFNAFLNYGYGILYSRIEKALLVAGLDPFVGFMHRDDYNQKSLVFDFIEPYRVLIDRVVVRLFAGKRVREEHTQPLSGGVSLDKPGKALLVEALGEYLDSEKVRHGRRNRSRYNALQMDAHGFAQELLGEDRKAPELLEL